MTVQLHLASGTINSHRGREGENRQGIKLKRDPFYFGAYLDTEQNLLEIHISIDEAVNIKLKLELLSWASLFNLIFELYLDAAFRPICDYT